MSGGGGGARRESGRAWLPPYSTPAEALGPAVKSKTGTGSIRRACGPRGGCGDLRVAPGWPWLHRRRVPVYGLRVTSRWQLFFFYFFGGLGWARPPLYSWTFGLLQICALESLDW